MKLMQMLVVDPEDSEMSILTIAGLAFLLAIIGLFIFGIRAFFSKFDARMKRRLEGSTTDRSHQNDDLQ